MSRIVLTLLISVLLAGGCKLASSARTAAESMRTALDPPLPPPDTIPELLDYSADLGVNITEMAKLPEGVLWADLAPGEGAAVAKGDSIEIYVLGWLPDGTLVDSSATAVRIGNGEVIDGLEIGLPGMKPGGRRQLVIPPGLGYGSLGRDNIPPDAVLVYQVDLRAKLP